MKRVILIVAGALLMYSAQAQFKPEGGSFCMEVQFRPLGNAVIQSNPIGSEDLETGGISVKYFFTEKLELRGDLVLGFWSDKDKTPVPAGGTGVEIITKNSASSFGLNLGLNYHFNGSERISPYVGALVGFGLFNTKTKTDNLLHVQGDYRLGKSGGIGMQVAVATGFNWYIVKGLYMGVEVGLGLGFTKDLKDKTESSIGGVSNTTTINPTASAFELNFLAVPAIRLGWKF